MHELYTSRNCLDVCLIGAQCKRVLVHSCHCAALIVARAFVQDVLVGLLARGDTPGGIADSQDLCNAVDAAADAVKAITEQVKQHSTIHSAHLMVSDQMTSVCALVHRDPCASACSGLLHTLHRLQQPRHICTRSRRQR
jgi:hypothetical protein